MTPDPLYCVSYDVDDHTTVTRPFEDDATVAGIVASVRANPAISNVRRWRCEWIEIDE